MQKKIVLLLGHSDPEGLCGAIADTYEKAARGAGHEVTRFDIGTMQFDPILHKGYRAIQQLEPDLVRFQEALHVCDHFVVVYPNWWSGPPAILKGFFDRVWLSRFAFRYVSFGHFRTMFWHRLMRGKSARLIVTTGVRPVLERLLYGDFTVEVKVGILWFAGFDVTETVFGPSENPPEHRKARWLSQITELGRKGV